MIVKHWDRTFAAPCILDYVTVCYFHMLLTFICKHGFVELLCYVDVTTVHNLLSESLETGHVSEFGMIVQSKPVYSDHFFAAENGKKKR